MSSGSTRPSCRIRPGDELRADCTLINVLAKKIRALSPPADISEIMGQVEDILDRSIAAKGYLIRDDQPLIDLSKIDFELLAARFKQGAQAYRGGAGQSLNRPAPAEDGSTEPYQDRLPGNVFKKMID